MVDIIKEMKTLMILMEKDILKLREYIFIGFPMYHGDKQKEILENTINQIINQHLSRIPAVYRVRILKSMEEKCPLSDRGDILFYDVLEAALDLDIQEKEFTQSLCKWLEGHVQYSVDSNLISQLQREMISLKAAQQWLTKDPTAGPREPSKEDRFFPEALRAKLKFATIILLALFIFFINHLYVQLWAKPLESSPVTFQAIERPLLPHDFHHREIDEEKLKAYLHSRNSFLAQEPYFSAIMTTAEEFELNPLVLFAITGHEQGFVPKDHPDAKEIANNPFNVFNSWQKYNTDINDSTAIAARTVINLAKDYPEDMDPFQWVNRKYAEDKNWWKGVRSIFNRLEKEVES